MMELTDFETLGSAIMKKWYWLSQVLADGDQLKYELPRLQQTLELLQGLEWPEDQQKLLKVWKGLSPLNRLKLLTMLEELSPLERLTLLEGLSSWEGLSPLEQQKLQTLWYKLSLLQQEEKLLTLLEELSPLKQRKLTLLEGLSPVEQGKLLTVLEGLSPQERPNLLRLLEGQKPWERWELLEALTILTQIRLLVTVCLSEECDSRGGFKNLLLDGWWLEFWEIILLAAGDVERNPGPRRMIDEQLKNIDGTILETGDLSEVFDAVYNCRAKWRNLCLILGISADHLSAIKKQQLGDTDDCLQEGLTCWLKEGYDTEKHGRPTWRSLVDAVANSAGGDDHTLALDIAGEHKAIPTIVPKTNSCVGLEGPEQVSSAFNAMYRSIRKLLRVDVCEVKDTLCCLVDPRCPDLDKLCVPREVYKDATSTDELLKQLCPTYINPNNTFILREIVAVHGSQRCKRLLQKYMDKFC